MNARKILLANDEESVRLIAATPGGGTRYKIFEAKDRIEAMKIASTESPDLVLLDVLVPCIDGFEVCRHIKSDPKMSGIVMILLTARAQDADKEQAKELGADVYFFKPFSPTAVLKKLDEFLGRNRRFIGSLLRHVVIKEVETCLL